MEFSENTVLEDPAKKKLKGVGILVQKAALVVVSANFFGQAFVLAKPEITLGRDEHCDISLPDSHISATHCKLRRGANGHYFLVDFDSRNGTFLNTKKIKKETQLYYLDRIVIGNTILRYFLEEKLIDKPA